MVDGQITWVDVATFATLAAQTVLLLVAALVARRQVKEARTLREDQARPFVVVDFDVEDAEFYLTIKNYGATLARDVRIQIEPPLKSAIGDNFELRNLQILREGVGTFAPGKQIRTLFDISFQRGERKDLPDLYQAHVTYWDAERRRRFSETLDLDLGIYWNLTRVQRKDAHDIHKRIEEIAKELKKWSAPIGGGILTVSRDDVRQYVDDWRRERDERGATPPEEEPPS